MMDEPASILVADDDPVNRALLLRSVEQEGHRVRSAENGRQAWETLQSEPFDVLLLDILMPEMDGFEVLERLKAAKDLRHLPVIVISALDELDSVVRCIEMGADDHLPKPFDPVVLRARINAGLTRKRLHDLEREQVRGVFSRFVPEPIVDEVLAHADEELRLGGERCVTTVLFADLRGFTTFAEHRSPHTVIDVLNRYLTTMSDVILDHGGTLVSYMGDGIMAVFGAPIELVDHADRAVSAAREMATHALARFNDWLREESISPGFRIGIGLNSGPVMAGNVGSKRRLEYAAIGDTTNTAARLEAMTKGGSHMVLVSDSTRAMLTSPVHDLLHVEEKEIRGRQGRVVVWSFDNSRPQRERV